jgi:hypothetical protein
MGQASLWLFVADVRSTQLMKISTKCGSKWTANFAATQHARAKNGTPETGNFSGYPSKCRGETKQDQRGGKRTLYNRISMDSFGDHRADASKGSSDNRVK